MKFIVFDFDGVFTNGNIIINNDGAIQKSYNIKDGMAFRLLRDNNIHYAVISGYKNNESQLEILKHLKVDRISLGSDDKLSILKQWCCELELDCKKDVAYMGDDINDLEIMSEVAYIGCPKDAVDEVKSKSNYISVKNGGDGCVRDFIEHILKKGYKLSVLDEIKNEFNYQINNFNLEEIHNLKSIINEIKGNIYFCGVGKSGNIAKHCCDLLKCISYQTFYFDILNSTHGDIGTLTEKDIILIFSNSGNTKEVVDLIPLFKKIRIKTIGICCKENSKFKELCDINIVTPFKKEISGEINKIPTNSYMSHLIFSNILVSTLKDNISLEKYAENHSSGNIGNSLVKIKNIMIKTNRIPLFIYTSPIQLNEVFLKMTHFQMGYCYFINEDRKLIGILGDGDLRRILGKEKNKEYIYISDIVKDYYYETDIEKFLSDCKKLKYIPILEEESKELIGVVKNI